MKTYTVNKYKVKLFEEFEESDLEPAESFGLQDELHPDIWDGMKMKSDVAKTLMELATQFYNGLGIDADIYDVVLTGSLANYNYSKYSDYDVHILVKFSDVNEDVALVQKLFDFARKVWNDQHDIKIKGFEVEVYIQEKNANHTSTGIYSLLKERWIVRPSIKDFTPDTELIKLKGIDLMNQIDDLEESLEFGEFDHDSLKENTDDLWDKIKTMRRDGLDLEGEFGVGNLTFKFLRRNSYIGKIIDIKRKIYDKKYTS